MFKWRTVYFPVSHCHCQYFVFWWWKVSFWWFILNKVRFLFVYSIDLFVYCVWHDWCVSISSFHLALQSFMDSAIQEETHWIWSWRRIYTLSRKYYVLEKLNWQFDETDEQEKFQKINTFSLGLPQFLSQTLHCDWDKKKKEEKKIMLSSSLHF